MAFSKQNQKRQKTEKYMLYDDIYKIFKCFRKGELTYCHRGCCNGLWVNYYT